jgi:hypothetical protein
LERERRLDAVRFRGVRGGVIAPHRSMIGLRWTPRRFLSTLLLTLGGLTLLVLALPWIGDLWQLVFASTRDSLGGLQAPLGDQQLTLPGGLSITLPVLAALTPMPGSSTLWTAGVVAALVFALSFALPARFTPLKYFLRLLAILQGSAVLFFAFSPEPFPYRLQDHVFLMLTAGLVVMGLVPLVLGLTLHVFDIAFWKKLLLTVAVMAHLAVFLPLKAMVHIWLVLHATAVVMPVLFLIFGLLMDVMVLVAFYGWVLSETGESGS